MEQDLRLPAVTVASAPLQPGTDKGGNKMSAELRVEELRKQFTRRPAGSGRCQLSGRAARSWFCWDRPAAARPRRCVAWRASSMRPRGVSASAVRLVSAPARWRHGAAAPAQHRHGVSVLRGVAAYDGQQNVAFPLRHRARATRRDRAQDRRDARSGRPLRICRSRRRGAFRGADAACGAGAQPDLRAAAASARRALEQPRCAVAPAAAR